MSDPANLNISSLSNPNQFTSGLALNPPVDEDQPIALGGKKKLSVQQVIDLFVERGYTHDEAITITTNNPTLNTREAIIQKYPPKTNASAGQRQTSNTDTFEATTGINFDFKGFNEKKPKQKVPVLLEEYTKNLIKFNPSALGIEGETRDWSQLSPEERERFQETAFNALVKLYNKTDIDIDYNTFKAILSDDTDRLKGLPEAERNAIIEKFNYKLAGLMTDIQVADYASMDVKSFLESNNNNSIKYSFINWLHSTNEDTFNELSPQDRAYWEYENIAITAAQNNPALNIRDEDNLTPDRLNDIINAYNSANPNDPNKNISRASLIFDYLSKKSELTPTEQRLYDFYKGVKIPLSKVSDFNAINRTGKEMRQSEVFQNALKDAKGDENVARRAYVLDLITQAKNEGGTPVEIRRRVRDVIAHLYDGASFDEMYHLNSIIDQLLQDGTIGRGTNVYTNVNSVLTRGADVDSGMFNLSAEEGTFGEYRAELATHVGMRYAEAGEHKMGHLLNVQRRNAMDHQRVAASMRNWSEDAQYEVGNDVNTHYDEYTSEARNSKIRQAGYYIPEARSQEFQNNLRDNIISHNDEGAYEAFGGSASSYKGQGQRSLADCVMGMANFFRDEANIAAQTALANDVQNCAPENQLYIHNQVMSSSYSEVQECAASNIHNYHESVQSDAIRTVYDSGNMRAIYACESQLSQCKGVNASECTYEQYLQTKNFEESIASLDLSKQEDVNKFLGLVENNSVEITRYLNSCSNRERETFVENFCKLASGSQQLTFLKNNPHLRGLVLKYANNINKEEVFKICYSGNPIDMLNLIKELGLNPIKLANTYKELAPQIAIATNNEELARSIVTNAAQWGYNLGSSTTPKLQELASKEQLPSDTSPKTAYSLRRDQNTIYPTTKKGILFA